MGKRMRKRIQKYREKKNARTIARLQEMRKANLLGAAQSKILAKDKPIENIPNIAPGYGLDEWREQL